MSTESFDLVAAADPTWDHYLAPIRHDFYHRRAYHELAQWNREGDAFLAVYGRDDARIVWPYLLRPIPGTDRFDVGCVYGYPGPVGVGIDGVAAARAWHHFTAAWREQGCVSVFTSFNPLLGNAERAGNWHGDPSGPAPVVTLGRSVAIDLAQTAEQRTARYEKETRYEIRRAHRAGLSVRAETSAQSLGALADLYGRTMDRNQADSRHRYSREYVDRLWSAIGEYSLIVLAALEGRTVGALLVVMAGEFAHAHLTGVAPEFLRLSPLNAMLDAAADLARERSARVLHLGAGRGGFEDSLFRFKRRIGELEFPFSVGRWVLDGPTYAELTRGADRTAAEVRGFFPAYRA